MVFGISKTLSFWVIVFTFSLGSFTGEAGSLFVEGDVDSLPALTAAGCLDQSPVLIFRDQISPAKKDLLEKTQNIVFANGTLRDLGIDLSEKKAVYIDKKGVVFCDKDDTVLFYLDKRSLSQNASGHDSASTILIDGKPVLGRDAVPEREMTEAYQYLGATLCRKGKHKVDLLDESGRLLVIVKSDLDKTQAALIRMLDQAQQAPIFLFSKQENSFYLPRSHKGGLVRVTLMPFFSSADKKRGYPSYFRVDGIEYALSDFSITADEPYPSITIPMTTGWHSAAFLDRQEGEGSWAILSPVRGAKNEEPEALPTLVFKRINPAQYQVRVEGAKAPFWLVLGERFHDLWRLYPAPAPFLNRLLPADMAAHHPAVGTAEAPQDFLFQPKDILFLWRAPLAVTHVQANGYANGWYIDPRQAGLGEDFELTIFFWPQAIVYLSYGFTCGIILLSLCVLIFRGLSRWKRARKK